ncbi:amylo-alpha-1,6-glucosidase [Tautonia plasticadhaerens]|uniref:Amylo-alpha-1,6-glucosidase n=1 Tax=Tautonia plasticadhaerens TaxID=2527974 RepID=A0A518HCQ9_9BACT|nr:amylo-alpha-1,6-glucosidase [Tautonia plasticadhaerens]QDV38649.1 Amylo-alpha-1,6-glucosidase [Tautonia plasticadhaerens]
MPSESKTDTIRTLAWRRDEDDPRRLLDREWLVTNGLGGYASGTLSGAHTRRYHGLLIAALAGSFGRTLMLGHLSDRLRLPDGSVVGLGGEERARGDALDLHGAAHLAEFRLNHGLPVWRYEFPTGHVVEKRLLMPHLQNTTHLTYRLVSGAGPLRLKLRPSVHFRSHDAEVDRELPGEYSLTAAADRYELSKSGGLPPLRLTLVGPRSAYTMERARVDEVYYRIEDNRGYPATGDFWSPGYFRADLAEGEDVTLIASTEPWSAVEALSPEEAAEAEFTRRTRLIDRSHPLARSGPAAELVLAADQFLITPAGRVEDAARAHAAGDELKTVIAGYHWFTDWGRDTMISLDGLTLCTGREAEARDILRTFAHAIRDGLIPNLYPEGDSHGLYHTADATLWFFHAIDRYFRVTNDRRTLESLVPRLREVVERHLEGTRHGIRIDPADGLLTQGEEGYQLTWMDAKVGDWVVTPRRGKAVELNALWYNALKNLEGWVRDLHGDAEAAPYAEHAGRCRVSFNDRFWYDEGGFLYDVVDGEDGADDPACRPNQIFAVSLPNPVLDESRWLPVFQAVRDRLLTPVGLRSLAPGHPDYKPKYFGDRRARDAAYHQGTVWAWLIGPFLDAWLKVRPEDRAGARACLDGLIAHLDDFCVGSIAEVFDAEPPFHPRGCIAQAWSVAEVLRCLIVLGESE